MGTEDGDYFKDVVAQGNFTLSGQPNKVSVVYLFPLSQSSADDPFLFHLTPPINVTVRIAERYQVLR
jgi:hypothetical protein